ncbi:hypothetical protein MKX03_006594, partial [Papaver bracteatum]
TCCNVHIVSFFCNSTMSFYTKPEVVLLHNKEKLRHANLVKGPWIVHCCWS